MRIKALYLVLLSHFLAMPYMAFTQGKDTLMLVFKGRWDNDKLRAEGTQTFNSLWGWTSPQGREYAIMGSLDSIYFIDISNPEKPIVRDAEAGRYVRCIHREFKTYKNYCYAVADEGPSSLQIFDLQYLPDSVHKVYDTDAISTRAHNLFIDNHKLYLADNTVFEYDAEGRVVDFEKYTLTVASLADPENPVIIDYLEPPMIGDDYIHAEIHDLFVRNDTAYCSAGYSGLFIYNYADPKNPKLITSITPPYEQSGFNHSSWLSADGNTMVFADEDHGSQLKIYDVSSIKTSSPDNLQFHSVFGSNSNHGSIAHNPFIKDTLAFVSYYHEGVLVYNISDPKKPKKLAQYDTYPENDPLDAGQRFSGFEGVWNVYPFFSSGNIIASDMTHGLFVLRLDTVAIDTASPKENTIRVLNNPFREKIFLATEALESGDWTFDLYDIAGHIYTSEKIPVVRGWQKLTVPVNMHLANGMYVLRIKTNEKTFTFKLIHL